MNQLDGGGLLAFRAPPRGRVKNPDALLQIIEEQFPGDSRSSAGFHPVDLRRETLGDSFFIHSSGAHGFGQLPARARSRRCSGSGSVCRRLRGRFRS